MCVQPCIISYYLIRSSTSVSSLLMIQVFDVYCYVHMYVYIYVFVYFSQVAMTTSSLRPLVFTLSSFLSDKEMDYIIQKSKPKMSRSSVSKMDGDVDRDSTEFRTSRTFFLKSQEGDSILQSIDARVANITGTSLQQQEIMQVDLYHPSIHSCVYMCMPPHISLLSLFVVFLMITQPA